MARLFLFSLSAIGFTLLMVISSRAEIQSEDDESLSSGFLPLTHRFAGLSGSSKGGKPMAWSHLEMLRKNDLRRRIWITRNMQKEQDASTELQSGRRDVEVSSGVDFYLGGDSDYAHFYFANISLGTPGRDFQVDIDTSSSLSWVQCQPCLQCRPSSDVLNLASPYDPSKSSSFTNISCGAAICSDLQSTEPVQGCASSYNTETDQKCYFEYSYADGSVNEGYLSYDALNLATLAGTTASATIPFGCVFNNSEVLPADGVLALGSASYSVPKVLSGANALSGTFSHCLGGERSGAGTLILGIQPSLGSQAQSTPFVDAASTSQYFVGVSGIVLGGTPVPNADSLVFGTPQTGQGTIIDSGTTFAHVPDIVYTAMTTQLLSVVSLSQVSILDTDGLYCWYYPESTPANLQNYFPNGSILLNGGASFSLTAQNYIQILPLTYDTYSACFVWSTGASVSFSTLGDIILRDRLVTYDNLNSQLTWVNYDCSIDPMSGNSIPSWTAPAPLIPHVDASPPPAVESFPPPFAPAPAPVESTAPPSIPMSNKSPPLTAIVPPAITKSPPHPFGVQYPPATVLSPSSPALNSFSPPIAVSPPPPSAAASSPPPPAARSSSGQLASSLLTVLLAFVVSVLLCIA